MCYLMSKYLQSNFLTEAPVSKFILLDSRFIVTYLPYIIMVASYTFFFFNTLELISSLLADSVCIARNTLFQKYFVLVNQVDINLATYSLTFHESEP